MYSDISQNIAAKLTETFSAPPYNIKFFPEVQDIKQGKFKLENVDEPEESKNIVTKFLQRYLERDISREEIIVDTTGGKVPMSIGIFQAAEEMGISSIYIVGAQKGLIKDPLKRNHGHPIFISNNLSKS